VAIPTKRGRRDKGSEKGNMSQPYGVPTLRRRTRVRLQPRRRCGAVSGGFGNVRRLDRVLDVAERHVVQR
jgi:hypothetical protein